MMPSSQSRMNLTISAQIADFGKNVELARSKKVRQHDEKNADSDFAIHVNLALEFSITQSAGA